jgi:transcriptional regulator with XRE-family HTH domain
MIRWCNSMRVSNRRDSPLPRAIRGAREEKGVGMRELERMSGLSQAQISRIEAGAIARPSVETLAKIAAALGKDARPLVVAAGHLRGERARLALAEALEGLGTEVVFASTFDLDSALKVASEPAPGQEPSDAELAELAVAMFVASRRAYDILGAERWLEQLFGSRLPEELEELVRTYAELPDERQRKVLDYAREQAELASTHEPDSEAK